ncbi:hypothetical protein [Mesorhizobium sp. KR1-2]|uniref:hypothetical protein n=1 Tax=Mesorhizobium sp. KR1-2 TaxID=3156609 RepID=UPI0032B3992A
MINGQPLEFTPYQSTRSVADITDEWLEALDADTRLAHLAADPMAVELAAAANRLVAPKVSRVGEDFSVIVRFFDGNGSDALSFLQAGAARLPTDTAAAGPIPGVTVSIRRPPGSKMTEVLMTRFDDAVASLEAFASAADPRRLPAALRPPAGVEVLSDIGDHDRSHISRTVISSGALSSSAWRDTRAHLLERDGFAVDGTRPGKNSSLALHARRGAVEADVLYTKGIKADEIVEVIAIRQLLVEGRIP